MIGGIILFANGSEAFISGYTSVTSLVTVQSQTVASQSFVIYYQGNQMDNSGNSSTRTNYITNTTNQLILGSGTTTTTINSTAPSAPRCNITRCRSER